MNNKRFLSKRRIFVTRSCGAVGREPIHQFLENREVGELMVVDNNESESFFLEQEVSKYSHADFFLAALMA